METKIKFNYPSSEKVYLSGKLYPEIKVGKINVDEQPELATQFQIDAIPALIVFKGGKAAAQTVGLQPIENIEQLL